MSKTPLTDALYQPGLIQPDKTLPAIPTYNTVSMQRAYEHARSLERRLAEWREAFKHMHVNNGKNDSCKQCGLDLRNEIHLRMGEAKRGTVRHYPAGREG